MYYNENTQEFKIFEQDNLGELWDGQQECTLTAKLGKQYNLKDNCSKVDGCGSKCQNDEQNGIIFQNVRKGTVITFYEDDEGPNNEGSGDNSKMTVKKDLLYYEVGNLEV